MYNLQVVITSLDQLQYHLQQHSQFYNIYTTHTITFHDLVFLIQTFKSGGNVIRKKTIYLNESTSSTSFEYITLHLTNS